MRGRVLSSMWASSLVLSCPIDDEAAAAARRRRRAPPNPSINQVAWTSDDAKAGVHGKHLISASLRLLAQCRHCVCLAWHQKPQLAGGSVSGATDTLTETPDWRLMTSLLESCLSVRGGLLAAAGVGSHLRRHHSAVERALGGFGAAAAGPHLPDACAGVPPGRAPPRHVCRLRRADHRVGPRRRAGSGAVRPCFSFSPVPCMKASLSSLAVRM